MIIDNQRNLLHSLTFEVGTLAPSTAVQHCDRFLRVKRTCPTQVTVSGAPRVSGQL